MQHDQQFKTKIKMKKEENFWYVVFLLVMIGFGIIATGALLNSGHIAMIGIEVTILAIVSPLILMIFKY